MNDDRIVQLLEEIRDLQRQQLARQEQAVANQETALQNQRRATRRILPLFLLLLLLVVYGPWLFRWVVYLLSR